MIHLALAGALQIAATAGAEARPPADPAALVGRLEAAWNSRSVEDYLALWEFGQEASPEDERAFALRHFGSAQSRLEIRAASQESRGDRPVTVSAETFLVNEPRALLEHWVFRAARRGEGWALAAREARGRVDGLIHVSLDPRGFRAAGRTIRFEDFELRLERGTLFTSPPDLGPTVLVFVGEGTVRFSPRPPTEKEQLRQFCGRTTLVDEVRSAFIRIHPADLHRALSPATLEPDPDAPRRLEAARSFYERHVARSFVLDTSLPGAPWWLMPTLGDSLVTFETRKHRTLSLAVSQGEPESISLFDRTRRRQICLYPAEGRPTHYSEDDGRAADVLSHDLRVRFEPSSGYLEGEDTLNVRLLSPGTTLRLKLAEDLQVRSVTSREGGQHRFFRVRHQDGLIVSLGALAGMVGDVELTVSYGGTLVPGPIEREVLQVAGTTSIVDAVPIESVLVYTNRENWYPQASVDDYATATLRLDTPRGFTALTGGERLSATVEADRAVVRYRQERPAKYLTVAVGRFTEVGRRKEGEVTLRAWGLLRTRGEAQAILERAAPIVRFYASEFGPSPYPEIALAALEAEAPGGHSPPGMVLLTRRSPMLRQPLRSDPAQVSDDPTFFLAHELAHQWWGQGIAGQNYRERWLSEGAAQYAAALWIRHSRGEGRFREVLRSMTRWALRSTDEGPIHLGYRLGHLEQEPQIYRSIVYDKGAYVLHMLRGVVGEKAFQWAVRGLLAEHRYGKVGTEHLREALQGVTDVDLAPYFEAWVYGTELPRLSHSWKKEPGRVTIHVRAQRLPGPVPLELTLHYRSRRETRNVTVPPAGDVFAFETSESPRRLELNADFGLLAETR